MQDKQSSLKAAVCAKHVSKNSNGHFTHRINKLKSKKRKEQSNKMKKNKIKANKSRKHQ
jgi:hypothetical protein